MGKMNVNIISNRIIKAVGYPIYDKKFKLTTINSELIPEGEAKLFAGNHRHKLDQLSVIRSCRELIYWIAKSEYSNGKDAFFSPKTDNEMILKICSLVQKPLLNASGIVYVDRQGDTNEALNKSIELLKSGYNVGISPEGTRMPKELRDKEDLLSFKTGAVRIAQASDCIITPYAVDKAYEEHRDDPKIIYGESFKVNDVSVEEGTRQLREAVKELYLKIK
jgi:1-acyl-sn-glycerol-3-phosphate acyltransferase